jgi:RNA polymerase sigma factor (sigma-70 family)
METAEDIASETFLSAMETWPYRGIPENPTAWLYTVAKNKARNYISRNKLFERKIAPELKRTDSSDILFDIDLSEENITDSQLQMLFAICHPSISTEAQIGLSLRILCGFGIDEIATAFLSNKETVNKRLYRAREKLREESISIKLPDKIEIKERLGTVLTTLYLLFSEGYYSESQDNILREDLCLEAMRLTYSLLENVQTNQPAVRALYSLMCFHASRFKARINEKNEMILYHEQDESLWDLDLISRGIYFLRNAAGGEFLTKYHVEAAIAYWHTIKTDTSEKWENILQLYNQLLQLEYSPIAALNRTYAVSKVHGNQRAIAEAEKLHLESNPYYFSLLGELYSDIDKRTAEKNFQLALQTARTQADRTIIQKKISRLAIE